MVPMSGCHYDRPTAPMQKFAVLASRPAPAAYLIFFRVISRCSRLRHYRSTVEAGKWRHRFYDDQETHAPSGDGSTIILGDPHK